MKASRDVSKVGYRGSLKSPSQASPVSHRRSCQVGAERRGSETRSPNQKMYCDCCYCWRVVWAWAVAAEAGRGAAGADRR